MPNRYDKDPLATQWRYSGKPLREVAAERDFVEREQLILNDPNCVGEDPMMWQQEASRGYNSRLNDYIKNADALELCYACPDRVACLEYALANDEVGIWGGTLAASRRGVSAGNADWLIAHDERERMELGL